MGTFYEVKRETAVRVLRRHYQGMEDAVVLQLPASGFNRLWSVETLQGAFVLKAAQNDPSEAWVGFANVSLDELTARKLVRHLVRSRSGDFICLEDGVSWTLAHKLLGTPIVVPAYKHLPFAAKFLRALEHATMRPKNEQRLRISDKGQEYRSMIGDATIVANQSSHPSINNFRAPLAVLTERIATELQDVRSLPSALSHGEFQTQNVIITLSSQHCLSFDVIDWDSLNIRPRIYDVCSAVLFFCRRKRGGFDLHLEEAIGFLESVGLSGAERKALPAIAATVLLPRSSTIEKFRRFDPSGLDWYEPWAIGGAIQAYDQLSAIV